MMTRNTKNEPAPQMSSLPYGEIGFGPVVSAAVVASPEVVPSSEETRTSTRSPCNVVT